MSEHDERAELRARLIDAMEPGRPVSSSRLRDLGLDLSATFMREVSRASRAAADDADVLIAADEISAGLTTKGGTHGRERAARALRLFVAGTDRPAVRRDQPRDREPVPPSVTPQATTAEDRREARVQARLMHMRGIPIEGFDNLDGVPIDRFDPSNPRGNP